MTEGLSRLLSYILRHGPEEFGLELGEGGWVSIDALLSALEKSGRPTTREQLESVVRTSDKRRFALSSDRVQIRANQGHSVEVDLKLKPTKPPDLLFHGTVGRSLTSICEHGLLKGERQHVHLSADERTAAAVGARRGKPVILAVDSSAMYLARHDFYLSANGVWLTIHVPARFIRLPDGAKK